MINSKKLSLVMLLSASMILAGCNNATPSSSDASSVTPTSNPTSQPAGESSQPADESSQPAGESSQGGQQGDELPTFPAETGKIAAYFYLGEVNGLTAGEDLPSYLSFFATGDFSTANTWSTGYPAEGSSVIEFTRLSATSDVYYAYLPAFAESYNSDYGFQIEISYSSTAGVGALGGMHYSNMSDASNGQSGMNHQTGVIDDNGNLFLRGDYGDGTFTKTQDWKRDGFALPAAPTVLKNYSIKFGIDSDLCETLTANPYLKIAAKGGWDGWGNQKNLLTLAEDKTYGTLTIGDVIAGGTLEFCVSLVTDAMTQINDKYNLAWNGAHADDATTEGVFKLGNLQITPLSLDGDNHVYGTEAGEKTILSMPAKANGTSDNYAIPAAPVAVEKDVVIELKNTNESAGLAAGKTPTLASAFAAKSWDAADASNNFSYDETTQKWTYSFPYVAADGAKFYYGLPYEFKITDGTGWGHAAAGEKGGNASFVIENEYALPVIVELDFAKLGVEDQVVSLDYYGTIVSDAVTITLVDSGEGTLGENIVPAIPGDFTNWKNEASTSMTKVDDDHYTYTIAANALKLGKVYNFQITATGSWTGAMRAVASGEGNLSLQITDLTKLSVTVSGDFAKLGVEQQVATVVVA